MTWKSVSAVYFLLCTTIPLVPIDYSGINKGIHQTSWIFRKVSFRKVKISPVRKAGPNRTVWLLWWY